MSTRRILNSLTAALADSAPTPTGSQSPSSSPDGHDGPSMFPDSSVPLLMTLHALLPDLLLPALDLIDRGLVERICRDVSGDEDGGDGELAFYAVYGDEDGDDRGEQHEEGEDDEYDIVRLTAWNCTCAEFAMDAFGDESMGLRAQMSGMEETAEMAEMTGIEAFMEGLDVEVEGYSDVDNEEVDSDEEERVVEDMVWAMVDTVVAESGELEACEMDKKSSSPSPPISPFRQATTSVPTPTSPMQQSILDCTVKDIVNNLVHSVAMVVDMQTFGERMADTFIQELADGTDDDTSEETGSEGQVHTDDEDQEWVDQEENEEVVVHESIESGAEWEDEEDEEDEEEDMFTENVSDGIETASMDKGGGRGYEASTSQADGAEAESHAADDEPGRVEDDGRGFGGISLDGLLFEGDDTVPCCKHLLACFLVEKCGSLLRPYIEKRTVDIHELAGMAAMSGM